MNIITITYKIKVVDVRAEKKQLNRSKIFIINLVFKLKKNIFDGVHLKLVLGLFGGTDGLTAAFQGGSDRWREQKSRLAPPSRTNRNEMEELFS